MNKTTATDKAPRHPTLVLVRGVPGSGKSYLTNILQQTFGPDATVILDPDATDYTSKEYLALSQSLTAEGVDAKFHPYRFLRARAYRGIESNKIIIWNQPFTHRDGFNKTVKNLQTYAEDHGTHLPLLVVEMEIDKDTAKNRIMQRKDQGGHGPSENTFDRFIGDYVTFADEGYNTITIHGNNDITASAAAVKKALEKLL